ncbi:MAG: hypothetical protein K6C08_08140 [Oscillospiraceae bacterium]|nr:hypothetical protein [Oscillospiraceae bacterium]
MKKKLIPFFIAALLLFCLCGCGAAAVSADPTASPEPTAEPTPSPTPVPELVFPDGSSHRADETGLNLATLVHGDVEETAELLKQMPLLEHIDLGTDGAWTETGRAELNAETAAVERPEASTRDLTWSDLLTLQKAAPQADLDYRFVFYGRYLSTLSEEMDLNHSVMSDEGAAVKEILPLMKYCKRLDMDSCGVSSEAMAKIRDAYPDMEVIWRIWFAADQFTMRTDSERLWCANFYPYMWDQYTQELKYLTHLKYVDLGHNVELRDWNFLRYMPDLEVLIITASGWDNLDMLENCTKLEYLEIIPSSHIELDLHPLAKLTNLEHLNMCGMGKTEGWEVLLNMTKLKRLWIGSATAYYFPEGAMERILEALPNTQILYKTDGSAVGSWRVNPDGSVPERYTLLRQQFDYDIWPQVAPYPYNDPKYNPPWQT